MGARARNHKSRFPALLLAAGILGEAGALEVRIGEVAARPGSVAGVPVLLDDASGVAVVRLQLNYDPQMLSFLGASNGASALGSAFALDVADDDGSVVVILYREDNQPSGSGELATLQFSVNTGGMAGVDSAIMLAEASFGDEMAKDLSWEGEISVAHGSVKIRHPDGGGIPDWWKIAHFGGTGIDPESVCSNGINTIREAYVAGLDPNDPNSVFRGVLLPDGLLKWDAVSGRVYSVYWTTNLLTGFQCLESNIPWTMDSYTNQGDGFRGYYMIQVELEP